MSKSHTESKGSSASSGQSFISSLFIGELFGVYDYKIEPKTIDQDLSKLLVLYGDNGTGKTTILNLLFGALSPTPQRGLKTRIARTPFKKLEISFNDGSQIRYWKEHGLLGSFLVTFVSADGSEKRISVQTVDENSIKTNSPGSRELLAELSNLNVFYYYLSDDRTFQSTTSRQDEIDEETWMFESRWRQAGPHRIAAFREEVRNLEISQAIRRLEHWYRQKVLHGSAIGENSANTMLMDVLKHISQRTAEYEKAPAIEEEMGRIKRLSERSQTFASFGLRPSLPAAEIIRIIGKANDEARPFLSNVLSPFLDGYEARLDALQEILDLIKLFLDTINSYFSGKRVTLSISDGIEIVLENGDPLSLEYLSSGEKQLLLLLCNTLIARDYKSVFLIDEPELSLNVKWQRKLLDSLMKCAEGTPNQFIIATHSVELLSRHRSQVVKLVS